MFTARRLLTAGCLALVIAGCAGDDSEESTATTAPPTTAPPPAELAIEALSARPEYVSGGDVTVAVTGGPEALEVVVEDGSGGRDVTAAFEEAGGAMVGLVDGLSEGDNTIIATAGDRSAELVVTNHPIEGPMFAGPHLPLPVCTTEVHELGPPTDADCSAATRVTWTYWDQDGTEHPLVDPSELPDDVGTTPDGLPFVVRHESGTINRAIYWIDVLDPAPDPDAWDDSGWNGRLVYEFGGGCGTTWTQGFRFTNPPSTEVLGAGYAVATATFNTFQVMCNEVLSAETTSMVKEHFSEQYGVPEFTIGQGGSGGAIQQYLLAQNYPGLLDAINPLLPFPDAFSIAGGMYDCGLLEDRWADPAFADWTTEQRAAVNGHLTADTCAFWDLAFVPTIDALTGCGLGILRAASDAFESLPGEFPPMPPGVVYDPRTNPDGLRCTAWDTNRNLFLDTGVDGAAPPMYDNVGVQYGLRALADGVIDAEQFIALNAAMGGFDPDGQPVPERSAADPQLVEDAYLEGRVVDGSGDLLRIPIITVDLWSDDTGDIHDRIRAFSVRDRLGADAPNHMIWTRGEPGGASILENLSGDTDVDGRSGLEVLDAWLTNIAADDSGDDPLTVLERARPDDAVHNCIVGGERVSGLDIYDGPGPCTDPFPISDTPRTIAGQARAEDVVKCSLQSLDDAVAAGLYGDVSFDQDQRARLDAVFPDGVCDYTVPGVGQMPTAAPWVDYRE